MRFLFLMAPFIFSTYLYAEDASKAANPTDERVYISSPERPKAKPKTRRYKPQPKAEDFAAPNVLTDKKPASEAKAPPADEAEPDEEEVKE